MKAQIQMQESIIVIFIFIVILLVGLIMFNRYNIENINKDKFEYEKNRFENLIITIPNMAELKCSSFNKEEDCIDVFKLMAFKKINGYNFGSKKIFIEEIYPKKDNKECSTLVYPNCGKWTVYDNVPSKYKNKLVIKSPVSLFFPEKKEYGIGNLVVEWYN